MLQNHLDYDQGALKKRLTQRHGGDLGSLVFDAEVNRRKAQDALVAELTAELNTLQSEISACCEVAGERRAKSLARLEADYAVYLKLCEEETQLDSIDQAAFASKSARARDIQAQIRDIALPRASEKELQALSNYASADSERLRSVDKKLPPLNTPHSELGRINMNVGLQKP
jgi:hypothetical protein